MSIFNLSIPEFVAVCGDWNTIWINGVEYMRFSGINKDPNYFAIQLLLCYAVSLIITLNPKNNNRILWTICTLALFVLGMLTYSKSYYLMVAVETLFILIFANNRKLSKKIIFIAGIGAVVAIGIIFLNPFHLFDGLLSRFLNEEFSTGRFDIWKSYFKEIFSSIKNILIGAGIDAPIVGKLYSHNVYIEALYHLGLIGLIAIFTAYTLIIFFFKRKIKRGLINYVCFGALLVQHFFLNGFKAYELPYYFMIAYIVFNTDMENHELIVQNTRFSLDAKASVVFAKIYAWLKKVLSKNILTRRIYKKLQTKLRKANESRVNEQKRKQLQEKGVETISFLQGVMSKCNLKFFFDMGTLLGIIREKRLLGHDLDIDTAVITQNSEDIEKIRTLLIENGCEHKFRYQSDELGVIEDSFLINGIKFDVNYYGEEDGKSICYLGYTHPDNALEYGKLFVVKLLCSKIEKIESINFGGTQINIPANAEEYLKERYGQNWRVPDKGYVYWKGPSTIATNDICIKIDMSKIDGENANE